MNLLLHTCCATCLAGVLKQLKDRDITCFFYNPNIHPRKEYNCRFQDVKKYCRKNKIKLIKGQYDKDKWFKMVIGVTAERGGFAHRPVRQSQSEGRSTSESESEGGQRCIKCYTMRLEETAKLTTGRRNVGISPANVFDIFAATLTTSPRKKADAINKIGQNLAKKYGVKFLAADFKKHNGYKYACEIAKQENFSRQNYCGCVFSRNT